MRQGLKILADAARMTFQRSLLLRCWGLPSLILLGLLLALVLSREPIVRASIPDEWLPVLRILWSILPVFLVSWGAVGWHRAHLVGLRPGWIPAFQPRAVLGYAMMTLVILYALLLAAVVSSFLIVALTRALVAEQMTIVADIQSRIITLVFLVLGLRASLILPAIALDETVRERISARKIDWLVIIVAGATLLAMQVVLPAMAALLIRALWPADAVTATFLRLAINIFVMIFGLSVVTALYGHFTNRLPGLPNPPLRANPAV